MDLNMDIDSDMALSINWGSFKGSSKAPFGGSEKAGFDLI